MVMQLAVSPPQWERMDTKAVGGEVKPNPYC